MSGFRKMRHSEVWVWILIFLLAVFLVLAVLFRVARGESGEPRNERLATHIVAPAGGTLVAGASIEDEPTTA